MKSAMLERARDTAASTSGILSWWGRGRTFLAQVRNEMERVTWPSMNEVQATTLVVILTSALFGVYLWGIDLILNTVRTQTFHPMAYEQFGIELAQKRIVALKSTQHFYAGFAPIAAEVIYVAAPGAIPPDFADIPFEKFTGPYWPRAARASRSSILNRTATM